MRVFTKNEKIQRPSSQIAEAVQLLNLGKLVVCPTETVYGLCCSIFHKKAVHNIFEIKKRPSSHSLPVVVNNLSQLELITSFIPDEFFMLWNKIIPGPLTIILKKKPIISSLITGGRETVAIRFSSNLTVQSLIKNVGCPLALTSANLSGLPSPTNVDHVLEDLGGKVELIINEGPTQFALESTILSLVDPQKPEIKRFGAISKSELENVLGKKVYVDSLLQNGAYRNKFIGLKSIVRLFYSWEHLSFYIKLSNSSKKVIFCIDSPPFEFPHFSLTKDNLFNGLRYANNESYSEILILCCSSLKKFVTVYKMIKSIAHT